MMQDEGRREAALFRRRDEPLDLPRQVMRRAGWVGLLVLLAALVLGLLRMGQDIEEEVDAAMGLAAVMARLASLATLDDGSALAALQAMQAEAPPRHLVLQLHDEQGRALLLPAADESGPLAPVLAWHRRWLSAPDERVVSWPLPRGDGRHWTVSLRASHDSERAEAMAGLLGTLALLLPGVAALLLVMRVNVRRALAPLQQLLGAIGRLEDRDTAGVSRLPTMPVRELERVAQALRHLAQALAAAEAERRALGQRVITLQEDERARLARELHDEFGQQLTALHVDAAWLARRVAGDPEALAVVGAQMGHCRHIQAELRSVLARLRPLPALVGGGDAGTTSMVVLQELLQSLAQGWSTAPGAAPRVTLQVELPPTLVADTGLPSALALALYRITQEALTNAARHAGASQVQVRLALSQAPAPAGLQIDWQVVDDGVGIAEPAASLLRGSGLAGIKERVWALDSELQMQPAQPGAARPGLRLSARFELPAGALPLEMG